jgi:alkylation response protein AidB-like acyl-CoA dehydrogenase
LPCRVFPIGEIAYQNAVAYARDRLQGDRCPAPRRPDKPADPIIVHPDVRRTLMSIRAFNEAGRAWSSGPRSIGDVSHRSEDEKARSRLPTIMMGLMTPVLKGVLTDTGFANMR